MNFVWHLPFCGWPVAQSLTCHSPPLEDLFSSTLLWVPTLTTPSAPVASSLQDPLPRSCYPSLHWSPALTLLNACCLMGDQWWLVFKLHPFLHSLTAHCTFFFFYPFSFSHHSTICILLSCPDGCFMCPLANILVLLTRNTADLSGGLFQGPSWPYPITFCHCTTSQHDHYSTPILLWVIGIYPAPPPATCPVHIVYSNCSLIDPHNLPGQPITSHIFPTSHWSASFLSFFLKMGWIHCPETLVTNQPMLHKIPSHLILCAVLLYDISLHHGFIWP